jgi:hypothetical protein
VEDPLLHRVFAEYDALLAGLSPAEQDRILRHAWIDDDGHVHARRLRVAPEEN